MEEENLNQPTKPVASESEQTVASADKPKFSIKKWPIWALVALILLLLVTGAYFLGKSSNKASTSLSQVTVKAKVTPNPTADWNTFVSSKYPFSIRYPKTLETDELTSSFYVVTFKRAGSPINELETFDIMAAPDTFTPNTPSGYNFLSADVYNKISNTPEGQSVTVGTGTFTRLPDETLGGQNALVVSNPGTTPDLTQKRYLVKTGGNLYVVVIYDDKQANSLSQVFSTLKFTDVMSPDKSSNSKEPALAGMKWYGSPPDFRFQIPNDFIYNNSSTPGFLSFLQNQNGTNAQRMNVQVVQTSDSLETYLSKNDYDQNGINSPAAHENTTVDGHKAIAVTKTFDPEQNCGITGTGQVKRTSALLIQGDPGTIYVFVVNDSCYTVSNDWFSKIFPTIRLPK